MIKTIDTTEVTKEMTLAFHKIVSVSGLGVLYNFEDAVREMLEQAPAAEPAQAVPEPVGYISGWINGHLAIRLLDPALALSTGTALFLQPPTVPPAISEPAQAVPVAWMVTRAMAEPTLEWAKPKKYSCLRYEPLYTHPAPLDPDTRKMVLELCRLVKIDEWIVPLNMLERAEKIIERLEAGE